MGLPIGVGPMSPAELVVVRAHAAAETIANPSAIVALRVVRR
jgi:hypothetical protein